MDLIHLLYRHLMFVEAICSTPDFCYYFECSQIGLILSDEGNNEVSSIISQHKPLRSEIFMD